MVVVVVVVVDVVVVTQGAIGVHGGRVGVKHGVVVAGVVVEAQGSTGRQGWDGLTGCKVVVDWYCKSAIK